MRKRILGIALLGFAASIPLAALAPMVRAQDSDADKLRDALRQAVAQTRSLEDQRTALQATVAKAQQDNAALKKDVEAARADARQVHKDYNVAVEEFNKRLAERDDTLEKWKSAYEEAATVARTKDEERAKFEGEASAYKASTTGCVAKNKELVHAGRALLHRYQNVTIGDTIVAREPVFALRRVEIQNDIQTTGDKILDQKVAQ
jgi:chromosome segregation ATPase